MTRGDVGPHALSLIVCNKIERERPELPGTYLGVTNMAQVQGRGRPGARLSPAPRLLVEARFAAGLARGSFRFGLRVTVGPGDPHLITEREIRLVDSRQEVRLARTWALNRVPAGPIWFESLLDDAVVMRVPFFVEIVAPPSDEVQA
jgi:hypothetical protein